MIPAGSQVVLKEAVKIINASDPDTFKKAGSVGVVIKCPPHNEQPYLIQFTDQTTVQASFDELVLRRQEIDMKLSEDIPFDPVIIYRCQVGSKAFGLATDDSDDDYRGIFVPPAERHWSLHQVPEQIEFQEGEHDEVYWELEKFLTLALKANPNILETLWTPMVLECNSMGEQLLEIRDAFLSQHLYKTYSGYVLSQFRRMKNQVEKTGKFKRKHAMHLLRLLYSGIHALEHGQIMIDVSDHRDFLMSIREGKLEFEEIREQALALDRRFQTAFESTKLPEQPDIKRVDQFLIKARRSMANMEG